MDRFRIVSDNDGHNYIIPADMLEPWIDWLEDSGDDYDLPAWAERIDHFSSITFTDWRVDY